MEIGSIYILIRLTTYFFKLHSLAKVINNLCIKILTRQTPLERFLICRLTQQINRKLGRLNTDINQLLIRKNGHCVINRVIDIL
jgi:hypothetical protein